MRAIQMEQFGDPTQVLRVVDIEEPPPPGPHEVLLSVEVSPLNKHDLLVVMGALARPPLPHIPGAEGVARVLATGAEVDGLQVGDLVVLPLYAGAWRERLVVPAEGLFALPADGSIEQYSMLGSNPPTAGLMLGECTTLQPGDWVVQNAANSGVGRSLIALAKLRGLKTINLARDDTTFAELTAAGADVVHVDDPDAVGDVRAMIGDARVGLAVEAVGGPGVARLLELLSDGGWFKQPTDALVRITASCICGSDLHPYSSMPAAEGPARMGHEFIGVVEDTGSEVTTVQKGDLVVSPFSVSDNTCQFCREGLQTACADPQAAFWDGIPDEGAQAEAIRVPLADGTLVKLPVAEDSALMPSLLTLSDVFGTGYHAAVKGGVNERTRVAVIGDGAVGLMAVLSAKRLGAEQIILMGRHPERTDLGKQFGATNIVSARGDEGIAEVRDLTGGDGVHVVLEAVGHMPAYDQAIGIVRAGGIISRVGVPQYEDAPIGFASLFGRNIRLAGGPAPTRAYIEELMPDILDGSIEPGRVFDATTDIDGVPAGYQDMADRKSLKVYVKP